jgi:hypothetical protein
MKESACVFIGPYIVNWWGVGGRNPLNKKNSKI